MRPLFLLSFLMALACGAGASNEPNACVPGEQRSCGCPGGGVGGVQLCAADGERFGICFGCVGGDSASSGSGAESGESGTTAGLVGDSSSGDTGAPPEAPPPAPDHYDIVQQVAAEHPDWLATSCVEMGGNNEFLFEVARRLRKIDDRWGLNWKRGVIGDMSQDVVDYHYGDGPHEESTEVNIIDMIVGHCGDDPQPGWLDVTQATLDANTIGMWTLAGQDL
jgi:hypothetical protein